MTEAVLSLKSLLSPSKKVSIDYPGFEGFKLNLNFMTREELVKIRKKATTTHIKKGMPVDSTDDDLFLSLYTQSAVKGWSGLKLGYVDKLAPIEISEDKFEELLPYTAENALLLMKSSPDFDTFVTNTVTELQNFSSNSGTK
jgi:hypothetical protein